MVVVERGGGRWISRSGCENREATKEACCAVGVAVAGRAALGGGRKRRAAWDWGMDSGMGSDISLRCFNYFSFFVICVAFFFFGGRFFSGEFWKMPVWV